MGVGAARALSGRRIRMDIIWLFFMLSALQPIIKQKLLEASRKRMIGLIERERKSRVILLVHRQETMSLLGFPVFRYIDINDPQLGEYPAASILKAAREKPIAEVDDKTLILADQAEKTIAQMRHEVSELLAEKYPAEKAVDMARLMTSGTWTHDYPITYERAHELGLPVRSDMPENMLRLMQLYPQPMRRQPSVEYVPLPCRSSRRASRAE